ncbi:hypothetical protein E2C01_038836 [Portunus trituberculatus]|uniref:Uncharacterized protein n=1 Tax=Portunus trituberculatus TaxID=210409 RepID=A0A5B7FBZ6_PORTR|nr:hypothetical protein [Portunus trituberculatus]
MVKMRPSTEGDKRCKTSISGLHHILDPEPHGK